MTNSQRPPWLRRAWRVRAVLIAVVIGLLGLLIEARFGQAVAAAVVLPLFALAVWADWVWLTRNHHRVNEWGLSRGKDARKKPK